MGLESYVGVEGLAITVESAQDLVDAIDYLHTQVMDNISEESPLLNILESVIEKLEKEYGVFPS